jgi:hypothetical protein
MTLDLKHTFPDLDHGCKRVKEASGWKLFRKDGTAAGPCLDRPVICKAGSSQFETRSLLLSFNFHRLAGARDVSKMFRSSELDFFRIEFQRYLSIRTWPKFHRIPLDTI